jgi:hypothetical protein
MSELCSSAHILVKLIELVPLPGTKNEPNGPLGKSNATRREGQWKALKSFFLSSQKVK